MTGRAPDLEIRKILTFVEEVEREGGRTVSPASRRSAAAIVFRNPYCGRFDEELEDLVQAGPAIGALLAERAMTGLGAPAQSYGKAGVVGVAGEIEHVAAVIHPNLGPAVRDAVGGGTAIIPSAVKRGAPGATLDVPLHCKDACYVRSHFDAFEIRIPDAPAPDELVIAVAFSASGRPHARVGGLQLSEISDHDGQR